MNTHRFEQEIRAAVEEWEVGKVDGHRAMREIAKLVHDWKPLEEHGVVYPSAESFKEKPETKVP